MTLANRFIIAGTIYGVIGMFMGFAMAAMQSFSLTPVHSHLNLLGWVSMVLFGLIYKNNSAMAAEKLAALQFWISNIGVVVMMLTLALVIQGMAAVALVLVAAEVLVLLGMLLFTWLLWKHRLGA